MNKNKIALASVYVITLSFLALFVFLLIKLSEDSNYPREQDLVFEYYTYNKCEYVRRRKSGSYYEIYVKELEEPIKLDSIVLSSVKKDILKNVKVGDKLRVSTYRSGKHIHAYQITWNNKFILSYDDFLEEREGNTTVGIILMSVMTVITSVIFVVEIINYTKVKDFFLI